MAETNRHSSSVPYETPKEISDGISEMVDSLKQAINWAQTNCEQSNKNKIFVNLLQASAGYLEMSAKSVKGPVPHAALATRSLFELNLTTRYMLSRPHGVRRWSSEHITDYIHILKGAISLNISASKGEHRKIFEDDIKQLEAELAKDKLPYEKQRRMSEIAQEVGQKAEYMALYKLCSKLIHPSALLVNAPEYTSHIAIADILQMLARHYAWNLYLLIQDEIQIPENAVTTPKWVKSIYR